MTEFKDKSLLCRLCGQQFVWEVGEQTFFASMGFTEPKRCAPCRQKARQVVAPTPGAGERPWRSPGVEEVVPAAVLVRPASIPTPAPNLDHEIRRISGSGRVRYAGDAQHLSIVIPIPKGSKATSVRALLPGRGEVIVQVYLRKAKEEAA